MIEQALASNNRFVGLSRQKFRRYYQPSRILLGVVPAPLESGVNVITLCFAMSCSYKPPMMAVAVQKDYFSNELFRECDDFVLAVPGESLANETLFFGTKSGRDVDKVRECGITLLRSVHVKTLSIYDAIANLECRKTAEIDLGDHTVFVGEVLRFNVDKTKHEKCLLSVGPDHGGYKLLARKGIHRIGVVSD